MKIITRTFATLVSLATMASIIATPVRAAALVTNPTATAKISFTFDDGLMSAITQAAPTLAKYGIPGTNYVITGCVGMTTAPNTCHANTDATYMSWSQINSLVSTYGWEIGSHTATHPYLATKDATDGQPQVLTQAQVVAELTNSKATLAAHGINATDFASPYGDYNAATLAQIAKIYATHRGFADQNPNNYPYNDYLINDYPVQEGVTVAMVKAKIDAAIANKTWLALTFHDIKTKPSTNPDDYEYSTAELVQIAAYVKSKQTAGLIQPIKVSQGPVTSDTNLLPNASFNSGISGGWTTDNPTGIVADNGNNGSYPDPTKSAKIVATTKDTHLFSPKVAVNNANTYLLKSFVNVQKITSGALGFYIDEYDANGNWISGQYKRSEPSVWVEEMNFMYQPSSSLVKQASLQIIAQANSGLTAYVDNIQLFNLTNVVVPPPTNLVANGTFDAGIASGWTTDNPIAITKDSASNGSPNNPVNSIKMVAGNTQAHLFAPKVTVDATKSYGISSYVNMKQLTSGEIGFYMDEYDANGNWISGQYKTGVRGVGVTTAGFQYKPTSTNVKSASLQIILVANSGITAYVDDVQFFAL